MDSAARTAKIDIKSVSGLKVKIFGDGADKAAMLQLYAKPYISGFTTNPTLMRKAGVNDYESFARDILEAIPDRPISFEVFADDCGGMERQALRIASWGPNVYVKIPVTNTKGQSTTDLVRRLSGAGIKLNVTAVMPLEQVREISAALENGPSSCISVFAGRIADTGVDPLPLMKSALEIMRPFPNQELIWASPRELLNVFQADEIGCHIITVTNDILQKLSLVGKSLQEFSLETVKMFHEDATKSGFSI
jgi:transaldolase